MSPAHIALTAVMVIVLLVVIEAVIHEFNSMPRPTKPYTKTRPTG